MPSKKLIVAIIIIVAVLAAIMYLYLRNALSIASIIGQYGIKPTGRISELIGVAQTGIASYNNAQSFVSFGIVHYNLTNASYMNLSLITYKNNPVQQIYLLDTGSSCMNCINDQSLYVALLADLKKYDAVQNSSYVHYITFSELGGIVNNSIIIIPSGLMPASLLPGTGFNSSGSNITIINMLNRGDTIIYIGRNFSQMDNNGEVYITPSVTSGYLNATGLESTAFPPGINTSINGSRLYFNSSQFQFLKGKLYGPLSYVAAENGSIVSFGNYPSYAWQNISAAASDLSTVLMQRFWMTTFLIGNDNLNFSAEVYGNHRSVGGFTDIISLQKTLGLANSSLVKSLVSGSYSMLYIKTGNYNGSRTTYTEIPVTITLSNSALFSLPAVIGATSTVPIYVNLLNKSLNSVAFHIDVYTSTLGYVYSIPIGFFNTSLEIVKYYNFNLPTGYYIGFLRSIYGQSYGSVLFQVLGLNVTPINLNFQKGVFAFEIYSDGQPVNEVPYQISINNAYPENGTVKDGIINYSLPKGVQIAHGNQVFTFYTLNSTYTYSVLYASPTQISPFYIEVAIALVAIILLNLVAKAPTRDEYYVDVPTFPPNTKTEVKVDSSAIINLFDTVNYYYHWKYMPLTAEEIKSGIGSNLRYNSMPISITLQNTLEVLDRLSVSGSLDSKYGYYMPKRWRDSSGRDIEYLVVFRKLRDYCVSHAMLFTEIDSIENADMLVTKGGIQTYVFIYSALSSTRKIHISSGNRAVLVFIDQERKAEFLDRLYAAEGNDAELMKMGIACSYIKLISTENLDQII
jgi:hypothetical protein